MEHEYDPVDTIEEESEPTQHLAAPALAEAGFSLNWQMRDKAGCQVGVTMRGATAADWPAVMRQRAVFVERATAAGWQPFAAAEAPRAVTSPAASALPTANGNGAGLPAAASSGVETFQADSLVCAVLDGKPYWKVKGGRFSKFGVTIWPETLAEAGIDAAQLNPLQSYSVAGKVAHYVTKDGKPDKVTKLAAAA